MTLVDDGAGAVRAFERDDIDLIIMDCQMPVMDGFEATGAIRRLETATEGRERTPIVALTANAMEGDRNKCLAAGMDDYLAKPFMQADLVEMLSRWLPDIGTVLEEQSTVLAIAHPIDSKTPETDEADEIDPGALERIRQMAGSKGTDLLINVMGCYLQRTPALINDLASAARRADHDEISRLAHGLKSSSANLGATRLSSQCKEVETACRSGKVDDIGARVEKIVADYEIVALALRTTCDRLKVETDKESTPMLARH